MILVDTNVLLDIATNNHEWANWSVSQLEKATLKDRLIINDIIYAELSTRYERIERLDAFLDDAKINLDTMPRSALFLAAKVFLTYRKAGGTRTSVLPDFFIGAHASVAGITLLTRDIARYKTYYPTVALIAPRMV